MFTLINFYIIIILHTTGKLFKTCNNSYYYMQLDFNFILYNDHFFIKKNIYNW